MSGGSERSRRVTGAGVELEVIERGDPTKETILLVHGYPDSQRVWTAIANELAAEYHVVTYDVRGAGLSEAPPTRGDYALEFLSKDLEAVIDAVSPGRPVHLVGHDWGSIQSWESVTEPRFEAKLASFTSISGPCLDHVGYWAKEHRSLDPKKLRRLLRQAMKSWYIYAFHTPVAPLFWMFGNHERFAQVLAAKEGLPRDPERERTLARDGKNGIHLYRANMLQRFLRPRHRATNVPVQVIAPTKDAYVSPWLSENLERFVPNVHRREVDARHWVIVERPAEVAGWIREMARFVGGRGPAPSEARP